MLHLQQAVLGKEWARTVLSNVAANELRYHTLIERLEYALQQNTKHRAASHSDIAGNSNQLRTSRWKITNFARQGRYGSEPSSHSIVPKYQTTPVQTVDSASDNIRKNVGPALRLIIRLSVTFVAKKVAAGTNVLSPLT